MLESERDARETYAHECASVIARYFRVDEEEVFGRVRTADVAEARAVLCYHLHCRSSFALVEIGEMLGGRDHSTIWHIVNSVRPRAGLNRIRRILLDVPKWEVVVPEPPPERVPVEELDLPALNRLLHQKLRDAEEIQAEISVRQLQMASRLATAAAS